MFLSAHLSIPKKGNGRTRKQVSVLDHISPIFCLLHNNLHIRAKLKSIRIANMAFLLMKISNCNLVTDISFLSLTKV